MRGTLLRAASCGLTVNIAAGLLPESISSSLVVSAFSTRLYNISVAVGAIQKALLLLRSRRAASAVRKAVIFFSFDLILPEGEVPQPD